MTKTLTIGSRGSALALWQSRSIASQLEAAHPGLSCHIEIIKTTGDILREASLVKIAGKGVFTKEIEDAILDHRVDLAVHSLKDLPTQLPDGLTLAAITQREDPRDAFVARESIASLSQLPERALIGTSSVRRQMQLRAWRPDLQIVELRGNVDTRLRKLVDENLDAIILACAGLRRLGFDDRITEPISEEFMIPAVGQGALGIEARSDDSETRALLRVLDHADTRDACRTERAFLAAMGGGCAVPIAAHAVVAGESLSVTSIVGEPDGSAVVRNQRVGHRSDPEALGGILAADHLG